MSHKTKNQRIIILHEIFEQIKDLTVKIDQYNGPDMDAHFAIAMMSPKAEADAENGVIIFHAGEPNTIESMLGSLTASFGLSIENVVEKHAYHKANPHGQRYINKNTGN